MRKLFPSRLVLSWLLLFACVTPSGTAQEAFPWRGYYMTFMRMPQFGLEQWKQMVDAVEQDGGNMLLLWMGGGFASKKFPITWRYNEGHRNVRQDFARELFDYAHRKRIQVLLCLTPFGYDGVNQYPLEHPELKAIARDGRPVSLWGMHSWGWNLCPAQTESQRFMLEYAREMLFDFYPNADGLMIESSDYAICHCPQCGEKFFENEFHFVQKISDELWARKPGAIVAVYPHYFSGANVPGFNVKAARLPFDPRWTLFFTPHSAHFDADLLKRARSSIYWTDGLTLGTPAKIRDGARIAKEKGVTGFVPSLEPFNCDPRRPPDKPAGRNPSASAEPKPGGFAPLKPFHFQWLRDGEMPLNELLLKVNRIAYREFSRTPGLELGEFTKRLGPEVFGKNYSLENVEDLLFLQETFFLDADWFQPSPMIAPERRRNLPAPKLDAFRKRLEKIGEFSVKYNNASEPALKEMGRISKYLVDQWPQE